MICFRTCCFFRSCALNPGDAANDQMLLQVAERWYRGCLALGAGTNRAELPDFDHLAFDLRAMRPVDNGRWIEPEGAAGVAWCEYMAWTKFKDPRFLQAADWALRALLTRPRARNPLYEVLLPYAATVAARMNAELGREYDVAKLRTVFWHPWIAPRPAPDGGADGSLRQLRLRRLGGQRHRHGRLRVCDEYV